MDFAGNPITGETDSGPEQHHFLPLKLSCAMTRLKTEWEVPPSFPAGSDIIITYLDGTVDRGKQIRFEPVIEGGFCPRRLPLRPMAPRKFACATTLTARPL